MESIGIIRHRNCEGFDILAQMLYERQAGLPYAFYDAARYLICPIGVKVRIVRQSLRLSGISSGRIMHECFFAALFA